MNALDNKSLRFEEAHYDKEDDVTPYPWDDFKKDLMDTVMDEDLKQIITNHLSSISTEKLNNMDRFPEFYRLCTAFDSNIEWCWNHYSRCHTGVCIELDTEQLLRHTMYQGIHILSPQKLIYKKENVRIRLEMWINNPLNRGWIVNNAYAIYYIYCDLLASVKKRTPEEQELRWYIFPSSLKFDEELYKKTGMGAEMIEVRKKEFEEHLSNLGLLNDDDSHDKELFLRIGEGIIRRIILGAKCPVSIEKMKQ